MSAVALRLIAWMMDVLLGPGRGSWWLAASGRRPTLAWVWSGRLEDAAPVDCSWYVYVDGYRT